MPKNMFKDRKWPVYKDLILFKEIKAARTKQGEYSDYKWSETELWDIFTQKVNFQVEQSTCRSDWIVTKEEVIKRVRQYSKGSLKGMTTDYNKFFCLIEDYTLRDLIDEVFKAKVEDLGPPKFPTAKALLSSATSAIDLYVCATSTSVTSAAVDPDAFLGSSSHGQQD